MVHGARYETVAMRSEVSWKGEVAAEVMAFPSPQLSVYAWNPNDVIHTLFTVLRVWTGTSSVSTVTTLGAEHPRHRRSILGRGKCFFWPSYRQKQFRCPLSPL